MAAAITKRRSLPLVLTVLLSLNIVVLLLHIVLGDYPVPLSDALKAAVMGGHPDYDFVVRTLRLPRALVACAAGACLAVSGALLQGVTRNPLAGPGVVGINAGAALAVVTAMIAAPSVPIAVLPLLSFAGALAAGGLTYSLARRRGLSPVRLLLVGVGISASAGAIVSFLLTIGNMHDTQRALVWMTGSAYGRSWEHLWPLLPWLLLLLPAAMLLARQLDVLQLGDEAAVGLGSRIERNRLWLLLIAVSLAGAAVATIGSVGFVGLMAPHIARFLTGQAFLRLLPAAALTGGLLTALADLLGRIALKPIEIPCGILIALVGAPYMVHLLFKNRHA